MSFVDEDDAGSYLVATKNDDGEWDGALEVDQAWKSLESQCLVWVDPRTGQAHRSYFAWADVAWQVLRDIPGAVRQMMDDGADESALFLSLWPDQDEKGMTAEQLVGGQVAKDSRMADLVVVRRPGKAPKIQAAPWLGSDFSRTIAAQRCWDMRRRSERPIVRDRMASKRGK